MLPHADESINAYNWNIHNEQQQVSDETKTNMNKYKLRNQQTERLNEMRLEWKMEQKRKT